ncbi:MAG: TetR family transcriptional regulator C-terminal domain-containing protein, partial [Gaiellaceae bacterium]
EEAVAAEPNPGLWVAIMGRTFLESEQHRPVISNLWVQALAEATEDPEMARYMRGHMREVHAFIAGVIRRAQEAGGVPADRGPTRRRGSSTRSGSSPWPTTPSAT